MTNDPLASNPDIERTRAHWDSHARAGILSEWTKNDIIAETIYKRITGGESKFWLNWVFEDFLKKKYTRALSVGCGTGGHELILARTGLVEKIDAFDLSEASIEIARRNARGAGVANINFFICDFQSFGDVLLQQKKQYDLVCFLGSLHHVRDLEAVLGATSILLAEEGRVVFSEYVGDCYGILSRKKVDIINRLLQCIDQEWLNPARPQYQNPDIGHMLNHDPSEATRSALILPFLEHYFDFELLRPYGGTILHMLYPSLRHEKINDGSAASKTILRLLLEMERILYEDAEYIHSDFYVGVCRKRKSMKK